MKTEGMSLMYEMSMRALVDDYRRRTKQPRMTSGERRVRSLRKEEGRLNGHML
jgi:hypothetical protein